MPFLRLRFHHAVLRELRLSFNHSTSVNDQELNVKDYELSFSYFKKASFYAAFNNYLIEEVYLYILSSFLILSILPNNYLSKAFGSIHALKILSYSSYRNKLYSLEQQRSLHTRGRPYPILGNIMKVHYVTTLEFIFLETYSLFT